MVTTVFPKPSIRIRLIVPASAPPHSPIWAGWGALAGERGWPLLGSGHREENEELSASRQTPKTKEKRKKMSKGSSEGMEGGQE